MKIATLIRCYGAAEYLERVLKNYAWVDKILVMNYRFNSASPVTDNTEIISNKFNNVFNNVSLVKGAGLVQHDIFNKGLDILKHYDYVFISDADEFILPEEQKLMIGYLKKTGKHHGFCEIIDFFEDINHTFSPLRSGHFVAVVKPQHVRFTHIRNLKHNAYYRVNFPYKVYHFGFVLPKEQLDWKIAWESTEENVDVGKNLREMRRQSYHPPQKLVDIINMK